MSTPHPDDDIHTSSLIIKQLLNISYIFINKFGNIINYIIYSFIIKYIEGILNILNNLANYFNISSKVNLDIIKNKEYKQYVNIYKWSNIELNDEIKYILYKPLRWRPTIVNKPLFYNEIKQIKKKLNNKFRKIIENINLSVFDKTKIINSFNKFKIKLNQKLLNYITKIKNKKIRNINCNFKQIELIKNFKLKYKNIKILNSDKNRGNVIMYMNYWDNFNINHLNNNNNNFDIISKNANKNKIKQIINNSKKKIINIIIKYKNIINDYKKALNITFSGINDKIGSWSPIPKVHKLNNYGQIIRKLRPIINLKNTIISISCAIIREISRKIIFRLKTMYYSYIDCDDVKDIIYNIIEFNKNHTLNVYDKLIICDINSMYDVITPNMVKDAFNYAIYELIPNYLDNELINLWFKSMNYLFKFCFSNTKICYICSKILKYKEANQAVIIVIYI